MYIRVLVGSILVYKLQVMAIQDDKYRNLTVLKRN